MADSEDDRQRPLDEQDRARATRILARLGGGDAAAANELMPVVYEELRALANSYFRGKHAGNTLQPTALVHEAFLRLIEGSPEFNDRAHFMAVAATAMRQILIDRHRRRGAAKRGGDRKKVSLAGVEPAGSERNDVDVLALEEALTKLESLDERQARVVVLRFYGGLTVAEVAEVLGVSSRTVEGEWRAAKAWLARELG